MLLSGLTRKQLHFADEYIAGGFRSPVDAYLIAYKGCSKRTAQNNSCTLLADMRVKAYIDKAIASLPATSTVNVEFVISNIKKLALESKREADKLRALELLGKYLKLFQDNLSITTGLSPEDLSDLKKSLKDEVKTNIPYAPNLQLEARGKEIETLPVSTHGLEDKDAVIEDLRPNV